MSNGGYDNEPVTLIISVEAYPTNNSPPTVNPYPLIVLMGGDRPRITIPLTYGDAAIFQDPDNDVITVTYLNRPPFMYGYIRSPGEFYMYGYPYSRHVGYYEMTLKAVDPFNDPVLSIVRWQVIQCVENCATCDHI